jgi:dTMP kinase
MLNAKLRQYRCTVPPITLRVTWDGCYSVSEKTGDKTLFITLEGGEGAGKTTQIRLLADWLTETLGKAVLTTREPGGTILGKSLRELLLTPGQGPVPLTELLLYAADRAEHVETVIRPALKAGKVVLCDRFTDSTCAYQGYGRGLDLDLIHQLNQIATSGLTPDLTLWLKLEPEIGLSRRQERDRLEAAGLAFHRRVHEGFTAIVSEEKQRVISIDASQSGEAVAASIRSVVLSALK